MTKPVSIVLTEADLVGENASPLAKAAESENHRFDLMRIRIDLRGSLGSGIPARLVGTAKAHEIFGEVATLDGVERPEGQRAVVTTGRLARRLGRIPARAIPRQRRALRRRPTRGSRSSARGDSVGGSGPISP